MLWAERKLAKRTRNSPWSSVKENQGGWQFSWNLKHSKITAAQTGSQTCLTMQTGFSEFAELAKWAIELLNNIQAYLHIVMLQGESVIALYQKWCKTIQQMVTYKYGTILLGQSLPKTLALLQ